MSLARHTYRGLCSRLRIIACLAPAKSKELQSFYETTSPICKNQVSDWLILSNDAMESKSAMLLTVFQFSISHQLRKHRDHLPMTSTSQHEISTWAVLFHFQDAFICSAECNSAKYCMLDFPGAEPHPNSRQVCQLAHLRASSRKSGPQASRPRTTTLGPL